MSTTIDQKVVEMRFDNRNFENNVKTTMSTLERLKQRLNLTGASKGLENIGAAAKKVDMSGLGSAVQTVQAKFSALDIVGVTALANIANQAVNAGKNLVSAFTIDPIKTGFQEYELKMGSIQTIMASTGESLATVNGYLNELNKYSDKTIYSFSDMTTSIGKFTNAGVKLEDAVMAIKGISNEAAVSGANANEASRAMYNFAQALSAGYVKLIDWKSIENANMGTMEFKNQLLAAAVAMGTVTKNAEGMYATLEHPDEFYNTFAMFTETLDDQWLTTEVLISTLKDYADETTTIGKKAFAAAQDVKTFSMMMDTLKETAQSGWAQTWEILVGDLEQAKSLFTPLTEFFSGIINGMSDWRNKLLKGAMASPMIDAYVKIIDELNGKAATMKKALDSAADAVNTLGKVVDKVIGGEFGNGQARWDKLTEAGYNWAEVQNKVNEKLGSSVRHTTELGEAQGKLVKSEEEVKEARAKTIEQLIDMSDKELKDLGLKQQEINALRELKKYSEMTGISVKDLANDLSLLSGRSLLINSFKNIGEAITRTFTNMKLAWQDIFDPITSDQIYRLIAGFHKLTTYLEVNKEAADNLRRTFRGVFAALDIVMTLTAGPLKIAFKALLSLLKVFDYDILSFTGDLGDAIVSFRDWIDATLDFDKAFEFLAPYITDAAEAVRKWVDANIDLTACLDTVQEYLGKAADAVGEWIDGLKNTDDISQYIVDTLIKGIDKVKKLIDNKIQEIGSTMGESMESAMDTAINIMLQGWTAVPSDIVAGFNEGILMGIASIIKTVKTFCTKFITTFKDHFEIHSPSRVMIEIGKFIGMGLIIGLLSMDNPAVEAIKKFCSSIKDAFTNGDLEGPLETIVDKIKGFGSKIAEAFGKIDFGKIFAAALGVGMLVVAKKAIDLISMFAAPLEGLGNFLTGIGEAFEGLGKNLAAGAMKKRAMAILMISAAVLILVKAIMPLTDLSLGQLGIAAVSLVVISGILIGLSFVFGKLDELDVSFGLKSAAKMILIAAALFGIAYVMKTLSKVASDVNNANKTMTMLAEIVFGMALIMIAFGKFVSADKVGNMDKAGTMLVKMAAALLTITSVIKIVSGFKYSEIEKGLIFIGGVGVLFALLTTVSHFAGEHANKAGVMMWKMSFAMLLMAGVVKIAAGFSTGELKKGAAFVIGVGVLFAGMIAVSKIADQFTPDAAKLIFRMGVAMIAMAFAVKIAGGLSIEEITKGTIAVAALSALMTAVIAVSKFAGPYAAKAGALLISMSLALLIMVGITWIVSKLDAKEMWKAYGFVAALVATFGALIYVTKYAKASDKIRNTLIIFIVAIALMVTAVVGLSFIDKKDLATATAALMGVMGMFAILMLATKYTKNTKHMRKSLYALLGVTVILAAVVAALSLLPNPDGALKSAEGLSILLLAFSSAIVILGKTKATIKNAMGVLMPMLQIVAGLAAILFVMCIIPTDRIPTLIAASVALGVLLNAFSTAVVILSKTKATIKNAMSALIPMLQIATGLAAILFVMCLIPTDRIPTLITASIALGVLLNAFSAAITILGYTGPGIANALPIIKTMGIITAELAVLLGLMSFLPSANIPSMLASSVALGVLLNAFASSIVILGMTGPNIHKALPALLPMALVVAGLAGILTAMSLLNVEGSIPSAIALSVLLGALSVSMVILSFIGPAATAAMPAAILMGLVVIELAIAMNIISSMDVQSVISYAVSLGILLTSMTVVIGLLGFMSPLISAAIPAVISLGIVIAELALVLAAIGGLAQIPGLEWLISEGGDFLQTIGTALGQFVGGIIGGIAQGATAALPEIATSLSEFMFRIQPFIAGTSSINDDILLKVGLLSSAIILLTVADFIAGITSLMGLGLPDLATELCLFGLGVLPFVTAISSVDPSAIDSCKSLAEMILILTAADLISGITSFMGGGVDFSDFGTQLVSFGQAVCSFSNQLKANGGIDTAAVTAATNAGMLIVELNKSLPRSGGWAQDIIGEQDLNKFATSCKAFAQCIIDINSILSQEGVTIQSEKLTQLAAAGSNFAELNSSLPRTGGIAQDLAGEKDLNKFGESVTAFANCMIDVNRVISAEGFTVQNEKLTQLSQAGTKFSELSNSLPRTGGIAQDLAGEKDLTKFSESVTAFANCMIEVNLALSQENAAINVVEMDKLKQAGTKLAELQSVLPKTGGWWEKIAGKQDIGDFGTKISSFADAIVNFSTKSAGLDGSGINLAVSTAYRIKNLINSLADLDTSGLATFTGVGTGGFGADGAAYKIAQAIAAFSNKVADIDQSAVSVSVSAAQKIKNLITSLVGLDTSGIENFKAVSIGTQIKNYAAKVADIDPTLISSSISAANRLRNLISNLVGLDASGIPIFATVKSVGTTLRDYYGKIAGVDPGAISSSASAIKSLINIIKSMAGLDASGATSFKKAVSELATVNISAVEKAFTGASTNMLKAGTNMMDSVIKGISSKSSTLKTTATKAVTEAHKAITSKNNTFKTAGTTLMTNLINGMKSQNSKVASAATTAISSAVTYIREYYDSFYNAGGYLVEGLADGISNNTYKAEAQAAAMAEAAYEAAKKELDINSPSKIFRSLGYSVPEGFAMGIDRMARVVKVSAIDMADTAINNVSKSIARIAEVINTDVDSQPTIRPVLDLSAVESGAAAISGLFNTNQAVGVTANVGAINTMMNRRNQNGVNRDVVSAIDKLRKDVSNMGNTYYTIDGVTYDSGSDIANAMEAIVQTARIARRV